MDEIQAGASAPPARGPAVATSAGSVVGGRR
jgi:hypothetical protein